MNNNNIILYINEQKFIKTGRISHLHKIIQEWDNMKADDIVNSLYRIKTKFKSDKDYTYCLFLFPEWEKIQKKIQPLLFNK